jgi:hypothetical protein
MIIGGRRRGGKRAVREHYAPAASGREQELQPPRVARFSFCDARRGVKKRGAARELSE